MEFFIYPVSQASDITAFKATLFPVGEDQEPMLEQAREIVRSFNNIYGNVLVEPKGLFPKGNAARLPRIDGKAKMSKSLNNAIYLSDEPDIITKKVMNIFTDPNYIRVQDPGCIENNTVFTYLDTFCNDYEYLEELKGQTATVTLNGFGTKWEIVDFDEDWVKLSRETDKQHGVTKLVRIEDVELIQQLR